MDRDQSPIDQRWIQHYCDQLIGVARQLPPGPMNDAVQRRIENVLDLVDAWQTRHHPRPTVVRTE